jgi:hypothetical protein
MAGYRPQLQDPGASVPRWTFEFVTLTANPAIDRTKFIQPRAFDDRPGLSLESNRKTDPFRPGTRVSGGFVALAVPQCHEKSTAVSKRRGDLYC